METIRPETAPNDFATGPAGPAWDAFARWLDERGHQLREEVRDYPTPIARCDVQLTKLLEHRGAVLATRARLRSLEGGDDFPTPGAVRAVLAEGPATDEATEAFLRERLRASLFALACRD